MDPSTSRWWDSPSSPTSTDSSVPAASVGTSMLTFSVRIPQTVSPAPTRVPSRTNQSAPTVSSSYRWGYAYDPSPTSVQSNAPI